MMLLHMVRSHVATDRDDDDSTRCLFLHYVSSTYPCVFKVVPSHRERSRFGHSYSNFVLCPFLALAFYWVIEHFLNDTSNLWSPGTAPLWWGDNMMGHSGATITGTYQVPKV